MPEIDSDAITIENLDGSGSGAASPTPAGDKPAASDPAPSASATQAETPADASQEAPADAQSTEAERFQKSSDYKRISRQRANAERRAMRAEAELAALRAERQQPPATPAKSAEIRRADFASDDEFHRALLDDHINRRVREEIGKTREEFTKREQAQTAEQAFSAFQKEAETQAQAAGLDFADDWQTLTELPRVSRTVAEYLFEAAEHKAALVHHLAENTDEVDRLSNLHPAQAFRELARLDLRLGEKPKPNVTKAPAPGPTVGGRAVHHGDWRASKDMDEFAAGFMEEEARRIKMG